MTNSGISDSWMRGDSYERYVGRWSRRVAPLFLAWLGVPPKRRWLDVGCGTGALCAAILDTCAPSTLIGVEPSRDFLETARNALPHEVVLLEGVANAIPLPDDAVDVVVSGLALNFVPDPASALVEMQRVAAPGGQIAAYVWDYAEGMQLMRYFWDAATELDRTAQALDEGVRFPLCRTAALERLFDESGLTDVEVTAIEIPTPFASFDEYWNSFLGGAGPAPAYVASLEVADRERLRERLRKRVPRDADPSLALTARAWAVRGTAGI